MLSKGLPQRLCPLVLVLFFAWTSDTKARTSKTPERPVTASSPVSASQQTDHSTPEAAFEGFKNAWLNQDWESFYFLLAPSERTMGADRWNLERKALARPENRDRLAALAAALKRSPEALLEFTYKELFLARISSSARHVARRASQLRSSRVVEKHVTGVRCALRVKFDNGEERIYFRKEREKWFLTLSPLPTSDLLSNERNIAAVLRLITLTELDIFSRDVDADSIRNYWVADVRGLHTLYKKPSADAVAFGVALADRAPSRRSPALSEPRAAAPIHGFFLLALTEYRHRGRKHVYDQGKGRNATRFGFVAFPEEYGRTGNRTFIINEQGVLYAKDTQGRPPSVFPEVPDEEGWKKLK